jgi:hypothetical protein
VLEVVVMDDSSLIQPSADVQGLNDELKVGLNGEKNGDASPIRNMGILEVRGR